MLSGMGLPRRVWQKTMIALATNPWLTEVMQRRATKSLLARRFVAGGTAEESAGVALNLPAQGIRPSLFYLGEYVQDPELVEQTVESKLGAARALRGLDLGVHVSVDPTQIGLTIDLALCRHNALRIAAAIGEATHAASERACLMLDMEDYSVVESTIAIHDEVWEAGYPVAITLQAYLRRTRDDLEAKVRQGAFVRLVKGAFAAGSDIAFTTRRAIRHNYLELAEIALSDGARDTEFYPSFATHDDRLQAEIVRLAEAGGRDRGCYEFEMLYGVRDELAEQLSRAGHRIRLYMPFGTDWWPYALRRVGENPRNVIMLARALLSSRRHSRSSRARDKGTGT